MSSPAIAAPLPSYVSPGGDEPDEAVNPFAPIVMVPGASGCLAKLGVMELGQVREHVGGRRVHAYWSSDLPGCSEMPRPAPSIEIAQQRLVEHIRDWFAACGHPLPVTREGKNVR